MILSKWKSISIFWFRIASFKFRGWVISNFKRTIIWMKSLIFVVAGVAAKFSCRESGSPLSQPDNKFSFAINTPFFHSDYFNIHDGITASGLR